MIDVYGRNERINKKVEATRPSRMGHDFPRLSPEAKLEILKSNHPDYVESGFRPLNLGVNSGDKVPLELADLIEAKSRVELDKVDLNRVDYDVDVLIIGAGEQELLLHWKHIILEQK